MDTACCLSDTVCMHICRGCKLAPSCTTCHQRQSFASAGVDENGQPFHWSHRRHRYNTFAVLLPTLPSPVSFADAWYCFGWQSCSLGGWLYCYADRKLLATSDIACFPHLKNGLVMAGFVNYHEGIITQTGHKVRLGSLN